MLRSTTFARLDKCRRVSAVVGHAELESKFTAWLQKRRFVFSDPVRTSARPGADRSAGSR